MANKKKIICEFCYVDHGSSPNRFTAIIQKLLDDRPDIKDRNYDAGNDDVWRLHDWSSTKLDCRGLLLRIRTGEEASYAELEHDVVADIQLGAGQHLVEYSGPKNLDSEMGYPKKPGSHEQKALYVGLQGQSRF